MCSSNHLHARRPTHSLDPITSISTKPNQTQTHNLSTKTVKRPSLALQRIHHIQRRNSLALRMLRVGNRIANDALEEGLEHAASFFVDHCTRVSERQRAMARIGELPRASARIERENGRGKEEGQTRGLTSRDTLHAATASETTDGGLGNALDVVSEDLAVALCSAFAEAFAAFSACEQGVLVWLGG